MKFLLLFSALFVGSLPYIAAHGIVSQISIDGKVFKGNTPYKKGLPTFDSVIYQIASEDPVFGTSNSSLTCGLDAKPAKLFAPARPGSAVQVWWTDDDHQQWPHEAGPAFAYIAKLPVQSVASTQAAVPKGAQFFKIFQAGKTGETTWIQQNIMDGNPIEFNIPPTLASGEYLLRLELIALHEAENPNGAQFYPVCANVKVTGNGTDQLPSQGVTFPGAYQSTDPGILDKEVYDQGAGYNYPGPPLLKLGNTGSSAPASGTGTTRATTTSKTSAAVKTPSSTHSRSGSSGAHRMHKRRRVFVAA